jgi:protocatechuate 3,4-dioxygenase beta subunit
MATSRIGDKGNTMNAIKNIAAMALTLALVSCGGGGGNPGSSTNGASTTAGTTASTSTVSTSAGDTSVTAAGSVVVELISGAGQITQSISAVEIAQVKATVLDAKGAPVVGTIVSFSESGVGLLSFSPVSKTGMTNSQGIANVEVRALDTSKIGATTVSVSAAVAKETIAAVKNLQVTNAPLTVGGVAPDPQTLASAVNFVSTDPADKAIVLQGAGGNGRTETGLLKFRVVDKNGTPVKGATVDFVVNPSADVTLNIPQAKTDGDGIALTSVSSKAVPTAVVVKATVTGTIITSQSDQLKVTTGLGVANGFEILPLVYNLDGALSGDSTPITARLVDVNSNPVADGVPVVMVATGGKVGTSSAGGCNTANGACSVVFEVQEPRPANGLVTITGSAKVGETTTLLRQLQINMSASQIGLFKPVLTIPAAPLNPLDPIVLTGCSKVSRSVMISNARGYSAPTGTVVAVQKDTATGLGASIPNGSVVQDQSSFSPSFFNLVVDPTTADNPKCNSTGIASVTASIELSAEAPKSKRTTKFPLSVTYPTGSLKLVKFQTADEPVSISMVGCDFETTRIEVMGSDGLTLPATSTFVVSASDSAALAGVNTIDPVNPDPQAPSVDSNSLPLPSNSANRQTVWLRVKAPAGGVQSCLVGGGASSTFTLNLTVTSTNLQKNTQNITVAYPVKKP